MTEVQSTVEESNYKFSVIVPIYNVGEYLRKTIDSIINQSIGFEDNIQLILVNDGSTDDSGDVCRYYVGKFPKNIEYIEQPNSGVSAACNAGLGYVKGKYLSLLGSDDYISNDTLEEVYTFFEDHYNQVDLVSIKIEFFEARTGPHALNGKFHTTRVIDIDEEYDASQLSGPSSYFKSEVLSSGYKFDTRLKWTEDAKFIHDIILDKRKYGVLSKPTYYYRRRDKGDSLINTSRQDPDWYSAHIENAYMAMIKQSKKKLGYVHKYTQALIMYDIGGRLSQDISEIPRGINLAEYRESLFTLISQIDDEVVLNAKKIARKYKLWIIARRYNVNILNDTEIRGHTVYLGQLNLYNIKKKTRLNVDAINIVDGNIQLEGFLSGYMFKGLRIRVRSGSRIGTVDTYTYKAIPASYFLGERIYETTGFRATAPVTYGEPIKLHLELNGQTCWAAISFDNAGLSSHDSFLEQGRFTIRRHGMHGVVATKRTLRKIIISKLPDRLILIGQSLNLPGFNRDNV